MDQCGNYFLEDLERLGRGGFGEVYKVNVYNLTKNNITQCARKYFLPCPENDVTAIREIADLRDRFLVEIKTQCNLNDFNHKYIAPIVMFSTSGKKPYFVMELAKCNLAEAIKAGMEDHEKFEAVQQILQAISVIHENEYLHRDLKPENILKYADGRYKITDFGLVKDLRAIRAEIKTRFNPQGLGSDGYRAPEVDDFGEFSIQTDIFAVGKIINAIYSIKPPQNVKNIISKCTTHFAEGRYDSVNDVLKSFMSAYKVLEEA
jgi:serine/threonine protein kinase